MTMEVGDIVLLFPIGNMKGDVVAFKFMDLAVSDNVVLFPCEFTEEPSDIVACKPAAGICSFAVSNKVIVIPIGGDKNYVVAFRPAEDPSPLQFTELWEKQCADRPLQFTEGWEIYSTACEDIILEFTEEWELDI